MKEIIGYLKDLGLLNIFTSAFGIMIISLAFVYIPGRMFGVANNYRIKNLIALISTLLLSFFYVKIFGKGTKNIFKFIYYYLLQFGMSIIVYVIIGMRLFDRVDSFLDKKGLKDKGFGNK